MGSWGALRLLYLDPLESYIMCSLCEDSLIYTNILNLKNKIEVKGLNGSVG